MAKEKTVYVCNNCGQDSPKWQGMCPACGQWNTFGEEIVRKETTNRRLTSGIEVTKPKPVTIHENVVDANGSASFSVRVLTVGCISVVSI